MINRDDPKQMAEALRVVGEYLRFNGDGWVTANWVRARADELDPPYELDRSLRGWVKVTSRNSGISQYSAWWACDTGLCHWSHGDGSVTWDGVTWDYVESCLWHVEPLDVMPKPAVSAP